jgi:hypothetical protein
VVCQGSAHEERAWRDERERIGQAAFSHQGWRADRSDCRRHEASEARKAELTDLLANAEEPPPFIHPNLAHVFHQKLAALYEQLQRRRPRQFVRCSITLSLFPTVRNWRSCCAAIWRRS